MNSKFNISTTECFTCNNELLKTLGTLRGVFGAEIDRIDGTIHVNHTDEVSTDEISATFAKLGITANVVIPENNYNEPSIWGCAL